MPPVSGSARRSRSRSRPLRFGIMMSVTTAVGPEPAGGRQAVLAVDGPDHREALELEVDREQVEDHGIVLDDEDRGGLGHRRILEVVVSTPVAR